MQKQGNVQFRQLELTNRGSIIIYNKSPPRGRMLTGADYGVTGPQIEAWPSFTTKTLLDVALFVNCYEGNIKRGLLIDVNV